MKNIQLPYLLSILIPSFAGYLEMYAISTSLSILVLSSYLKQLAKQTIGAILIFLHWKWSRSFPLSLASPMNFTRLKNMSLPLCCITLKIHSYIYSQVFTITSLAIFYFLDDAWSMFSQDGVSSYKQYGNEESKGCTITSPCKAYLRYNNYRALQNVKTNLIRKQRRINII